MQFLNTIWLWGLASLIVPIGIHLLSRKTGKLIRFGSIRNLTDTDTRQFKSLRLNEFVLLVLRCLIIALLVFFIGKLHFSALEKKERWLLVDKGLEGDADFAILTDSLTAQGFEIRSLSLGFPFLGDSTSVEQNIDYWGLLEKIKGHSLEQVVIVANNFLEGFKGKRPSLPGHIHWISKDPGSNEYVLNAIKELSDSITVRVGKSSAHKTFFDSRTVKQNDVSLSAALNSVKVELKDTLSVAVVYDPAHVYDKDILIAAMNAVENKTAVIPRVEAIPTDRYSSGTKSDWIFWLSQTKSPNTRAILIEMDEEPGDGDLFVPATTSGETVKWRLTRRLNEDVALKDNLAVQLALIMAQTEKYDKRVGRLDRRTLPEEMLWSKKYEDGMSPQTNVETKSSERTIAIALLLTLVAERLLALKRNQ